MVVSKRRRLVISVLEHCILMVVSIAAAEPATNLYRPFNNTIQAAYIFGDSTCDSGNNNHIPTLIKANYPPYGTSFPNHIPTGRFSDGRLVTDIIVEYIGIKENLPAYMNPNLSLEELMSGVSFASSGSGLDPLTGHLLKTIPLQKQLEHFRECKMRIEAAIGKEATKSLLRNSGSLISTGVIDVIVTYYGSQLRRHTFDIDSYLQFLLQNLQQFIHELIKEEVTVIGVVGMPPLGCLPALITLLSGGKGVVGHRRHCIDFLSSVAIDYNHKLQNMLANMQTSNNILIYGDIYTPLSNMIHNPSHFGFEEVSKGCCGTGLLEVAELCNPASLPCENPSKYVFFDSVHPTQAADYYIFDYLKPTIDTVLLKFSHLQN